MNTEPEPTDTPDDGITLNTETAERIAELRDEYEPDRICGHGWANI